MRRDLESVKGALARAVHAARRADLADLERQNAVRAPVTSVAAVLSGADVVVPVSLTLHAVERYVERVQPCADFDLAVSQIARLFALGAVEPRPAEWDASRRPALMYLTVGDVSFVLDVDARDREALVARTCVTRGLRRSSTRRPRRRLRNPRAETFQAPPASARYRRPAPGQLDLHVYDLEQF
jgi:hypothetical protein